MTNDSNTNKPGWVRTPVRYTDPQTGESYSFTAYSPPPRECGECGTRMRHEPTHYVLADRPGDVFCASCYTEATVEPSTVRIEWTDQNGRSDSGEVVVVEPWSFPAGEPAHDRMVEAFSGGPKRELVPCDGDPTCTWAAEDRYAQPWGEGGNLCEHHYREAMAKQRARLDALKPRRYYHQRLRDAETNETGPSAVASAPPARPRLVVYCQGDSE